MEVSYRRNYGRPHLTGLPVGHVRIFTVQALREFLDDHDNLKIHSMYCVSNSYGVEKPKRRLISLTQIYNFIERFGSKFNNKFGSEIVVIARSI